jgi:putative transposase
MNRSVRRRVVFTEPADYRAFLSILNEALREHPVRLIAYSIMPSHWQLVLGQSDPTSVARCLNWVTSTHATRLNGHRPTGDDGPMYQGRCASIEVPAVGHLVRVARSVERDALQAGLVRRAQDWPWCSLSERLQSSPCVPLVNAPFLCSRAWADYVNTTRPGDEVAHRLMRTAPSEDLAEAPGGLA